MEIKSITITNRLARPSLAKVTVVIRHDNGIQESFKTELQGNRATAACETYNDGRCCGLPFHSHACLLDMSSSPHQHQLSRSIERINCNAMSRPQKKLFTFQEGVEAMNFALEEVSSEIKGKKNSGKRVLKMI